MDLISRLHGLLGLLQEDWGNIIKMEVLINRIKEISQEVIGPIAKPDSILLVDGLPKTRSGKIMRRILRKIAAGDFENFGDTSTLIDPKVVDGICERLK